ncbi:MAG: peptidylprolyl isomerase, partial [Magnetococcales bacterium]|nr:peptidylprolyl isomerase [Magnetococcales bacterium]
MALIEFDPVFSQDNLLVPGPTVTNNDGESVVVRRFVAKMMFVVFAFLLGLEIFSSAQAGQLDRIVAVVEGDIITASDVNRVAEPIIRRLAHSGELRDESQVRRRALEELIARKLRERKARALNIQVADKDIDQAMVQVAKNNKMELKDFLQELRRQNMTQEDFREDLRQELLQSHLIGQVIRPLVTVTEDEIRDLQRTLSAGDGPEQIHLGHILLAMDEKMPADRIEKLRQLADGIVRRLRTGESLAPLASQYSDDATGLKGGDMGWFKRGEMVPELEKVLFPLSAGSVAGPLQTTQGLHIFQVLERKSASIRHKSGPKEEIHARHILLKLPENPTPEEVNKVRDDTL